MKTSIEESVGVLQNAEGYLSATGEQLLSMSTKLNVVFPELIKSAPMGKSIDATSSFFKMLDWFEDTVKAVRKEAAKAKEVYLPEKFHEEEITTFNTDRYRVSCSDRVFASITDNEDGKAFDWLRENDYGALIKPTVNASSLSSVAKELLESGRELPDDMFRVHNKSIVSITVKKPARG
jgi:hypothetical protein